GAATEETFARLVELEIVERRSETRFAGEEEAAFRHALVREGADAMLAERDRVIGHKLAGEWLERVGEQDPMVLAEHFDRGGEAARAAGFYMRAAERTIRGGDAVRAIACSERGILCAGDNDM